MTSRERIEHLYPVLRNAQGQQVPSHKAPRLILDVSVLLTLAGLLVGGGMAWQQFLDDGKRLDGHDQEIRELTQLQQQQQQTLAALSQNVSDIKESVTQGHHR